MKKIFIVFTMFFLLFKIYAYDFNLNMEAQFFYNNYIKNDAYNFMAMQTTLTAFESIQKSRVKIKETIEQIKLDFDARLYLKPNQNKFEYFIDSLYFSFENGPFMLYTGKQRIKWGVGYTWNPTDKLQSGKNVLDPNKDLEGIYALRLEYANDFITPSFIIAPDPQPVDKDFRENLKFAMQLYKLIGSADFYINGIYQMNNLQVLGASISYDTGFMVLNLEGAAIRYVTIPVEFNGIFGYESDTLDWSYIIGFTKSFDSNIFVSGEYYYTGWGMTEKQYNDYIIINKISSFGMKKRYLSLNMSWTWNEKISFSAVFIYGEQDSTILFYPKIEYIENSNFNVEIGLIENITDKNKESYYSMPFYNIINLKLKAYF
ncbi:MAG: hypothetical protein N3E50_06525 [Candidatus Goldbacteria bacterium]|nr:hypothetical protein [Candidatus Goldiibacteriota bacterium]